MEHTRMDQKIRNVLFEPYLTDRPVLRDGRGKDTTGGVHLGAVIGQLVSSTSLLHSELPHLDTLIKNASVVQDMSTIDLKKVIIFKETFENS